MARRKTSAMGKVTKSLRTTRRVVGSTVSTVGRLVTGSVRVLGRAGLDIAKKTSSTLKKMMPRRRKTHRRRHTHRRR
jgi:hypothetical protein